MDYPCNLISAKGSGEEDPARIYVSVQSEYIPIDETALAHAIQQWLLDNVEGVVSTSADRHEQLFPVTPLPPLGS
jgi:hypothetical protein